VQVLTEATKVAVNNIADGEAWNNMVSAAERVRESARDILVRFYHISRSSDTTASL
jgi:negative regulator of replication initiation